MCGLCGLLGVTHWTETSAHETAFGGADMRTPRAERMHRIAIVNALLKPARAKLTTLQASSYLLTSATGRTAIVDDIQAVWGSVETLCGGAIDPLDPSYLQSLTERARDPG